MPQTIERMVCCLTACLTGWLREIALLPAQCLNKRNVCMCCKFQKAITKYNTTRNGRNKDIDINDDGNGQLSVHHHHHHRRRHRHSHWWNVGSHNLMGLYFSAAFFLAWVFCIQCKTTILRAYPSLFSSCIKSHEEMKPGSQSLTSCDS